ncbi:BLUF domain-containing protein [Hymenobacter cellulosilyticus]|uniref:BLUF domain-containing protein n=1 Tax=Hymenobacter cellulosilyticus TaxID=2932248 RepID=A0A8T9Q3F5_9BACT|nr:BLUF domain-containing protein [Hymenobacter cellulosilyticus]UOQ70330.1 BLUF domain-containing protein [Hymenobacter cellulosilyticus]
MPLPLPYSLHHLAYQSTATSIPSEQELEDMLTQARAANLEYGLTGVLLYSQGRFMQVLEGSEEAVHFIYARIERDTRHHNVTTLTDGPISQRSFAHWSMGFNVMQAEHFRHLPGYLDPNSPAFSACIAANDTTALHTLLTAFLTEEPIRY